MLNEDSTTREELVAEEIGQDREMSIALVAHDNKKEALLEWAHFNRNTLKKTKLYATGTTGTLLEEVLGVGVNKMLSGPLGGDQQLGARISEGKIDLIVFFWDPLEPQPHDPDVKALLRIATVWNVPLACNRATADYLISSPLMAGEYEPEAPDFTTYYNSRPKDVLSVTR